MYRLFYELVPLRGARGQYYRSETRLYFNPKTKRRLGDGLCKGVVWMCNPGNVNRPAALGTPGWHPANLDPTLNEVFKVFSGAVAVKYANNEPDDDIYLQIMNLFYVVNSDSKLAYSTWLPLKSKPPIESILPQAKFVWFAWGYKTVVTPSIQTAFYSAAQIELNKIPLPYFYLDGTGNVPPSGTKNPAVSFIHVLHPLRFKWGGLSNYPAIVQMASLL